MGMGRLEESGVIAMFFVSLAVFYRALAASMLATSEFSLEARNCCDPSIQKGSLEAYAVVLAGDGSDVLWTVCTIYCFGCWILLRFGLSHSGGGGFGRLH
jgi:hypothetical protein